MDSTWASDSETFFMTWGTRASKSAYLGAVDAGTGDVTVLARDTSKTFVETNQRDPLTWYVTDDGDDAFWWSERDGWAHIWRFDSSGGLKNQVTSGPWAVGAIRYVDEAGKNVYFTAYGREEGRNPYYGPLYRVGFDGSNLQILTPEDGKHQVEFSPDGRFLVDTYSTIEKAPVTLLRAAPDGRVVLPLEEGDASGLEAVGWKPSQVFKVKARDGQTDILVANDQHANFLWRNLGAGRFEERGLMSGVAYNGEGAVEASMGVTAGDFDSDGDDDLYVH